MDGIEIYEFLLKLLLNFKVLVKLIVFNEWNEIRSIVRSSTECFKRRWENMISFTSKSLLHVWCVHGSKEQIFWVLNLHLKLRFFFVIFCFTWRLLLLVSDQFIGNLEWFYFFHEEISSYRYDFLFFPSRICKFEREWVSTLCSRCSEYCTTYLQTTNIIVCEWVWLFLVNVQTKLSKLSL